MDNRKNKFNEHIENMKKLYPAFIKQKKMIKEDKEGKPTKYINVECRFKAGTKKIEKNEFLDLRGFESIDDLVDSIFRLQIVGKSQSGKSYLTASILYYLMVMTKTYKPENVYIFSPTMGKLDKSYNCIPFEKKNIFRTFTSKKFKEIYDKYEEIQIKHDEEDEPRDKVLIIFDDIVSQMNPHDKTLQALFYNCRHANISLFLLSQGYNSIPKAYRRQATHSIIFSNLNNQDYRDFLEETSTPIKLVKKMYEYISDKKHNFIFLNNQEKKPYINLDRFIEYSTKDLDKFIERILNEE